MGSINSNRKNKFRFRKYLEQFGLCYWCNEPMNFERKKSGMPTRLFCSFEHLINVKDGGKFNDRNIVLAHSKCNMRRDREETKRERKLAANGNRVRDLLGCDGIGGVERSAGDSPGVLRVCSG